MRRPCLSTFFDRRSFAGVGYPRTHSDLDSYTNLKSTAFAASDIVALLTPVSVKASPLRSVMTAFPAALFVVSASSAIRSALWLAAVRPTPNAEALNSSKS